MGHLSSSWPHSQHAHMWPQLENTAPQSRSRHTAHVFAGRSPSSSAARAPPPAATRRCRTSSRRLLASWMRFLRSRQIFYYGLHTGM